MKFFSEFGSCWGGVTIGSSADAAAVRWRTEEQERRHFHHHTHSQSRQAKVNPRGGGGGSTTLNWKPKLNAISENSPLPEVDKGGAVRKPIAGADARKLPVKAKPKSPARASPPPYHEEEYWRSPALSGFSPTSFLF